MKKFNVARIIFEQFCTQPIGITRVLFQAAGLTEFYNLVVL